jgi:hypothetical protein
MRSSRDRLLRLTDRCPLGARTRRLNITQFALASALFCSCLYLVLVLSLRLERGLVRTVQIGSASRPDYVSQVTQHIGSESLDKERRDAGLAPARAFDWAGVWYVPTGTIYEIRTGVNDEMSLTTDGRPVLDRRGVLQQLPTVNQIGLAAGPHWLTIRYVQSDVDHLHLSWSTDGGVSRPFGQLELYSNSRVMRAYHALAPLKWLTILSWFIVVLERLAAVGLRLRRTTWSSTDPRFRRAVIGALLISVLTYAALLRYEALVRQWGFIPGSNGAQHVQTELATFVSRIRPVAMDWSPSPFAGGGDPFAYLQQARERSDFYGPHVREPLFVFSVKGFLNLLGDSDLSVFVASGLFSWLTVAATCLLGMYAFSPWVGLAAALTLAVERDVIGLGIAGYRDDAFSCFILLLAYASLRMRARPTRLNAVVWGLVAAGTCLVRLTALSVVLPALLWCMWVRPVRLRLRSAAVGLATCALVISPFLVNCWIRFGDPFYAVTGLRPSWEWEQTAGHEPAGWFRYVLGRLAERPFGFLDTLYLAAADAFQNKWQGFGPWSILPLGQTLPALASIGLMMFFWSSRGRLLLLVLATSLAPYFFVWEMPLGNQYRLTLHAYPFLLIAAFACIDGAFRALPSLLQWHDVRPIAARALVTLAVAGAGWLGVMLLPYARCVEDLRRDGRETIVAGPRDRLFFRTGWHAPTTVGNVTARFTSSIQSTIWVPLLAGQDAVLIMRLDPFVFDGAPPQVVQVMLNGSLVSTFTLHWTPEQFGTYISDVPAGLVHGGLNRLDLRSSYLTLAGSVSRPVPQTVERQPTFAEVHRAVDVNRAVPMATTARPAHFESTLTEDQRVGFRCWYVSVTNKATPTGESTGRSSGPVDQ